MEMAVVQREHIPDGIALSENHLARLRPALRVGRERQPGGQQVVELSQHERRQEQWCAGLAEGSDGFSVLVLAAISCGQQTTCVEKDHTSPKPARSSSTFSARSGLPLANNGSMGSAWRDCSR